MKNNITLAAAAMLMLASCAGESSTSESNINEPQRSELKDVAGRKNFGSQHPLITPQPCIMIATYDAEGIPDVMMAAWGGQYGSNKITFDLSSHQTTDNIRLKKAFTVSFATEDDVAQSDYFGSVSARNVHNKVAKAGFTVTPSPNVDAPIINEYRLTLECLATEIIDTDNGGARVVGEIVNWSADPAILNEDGRVDLSLLRPVIFDAASATYRAVGDSVGKAWGSGKKYE